jgi:uncharacterized damage-inducible protein DinB
MKTLDPRIRTALTSVNPTTQHPAWHGVPTALGVLRGVSPAAAVWRPIPGANNIREIALHIAFWENSLANRLSGASLPAGFQQRKTSWAVMLESVDAAQWRAEVALVKQGRERLAAALAGFDPRLLDKPLGDRTTRCAAEFIHGVAEHSLYHTAQLEMIKTLARHAGVR